MPDWVKTAVDGWAKAAGIVQGKLFRSIRKNGTLWGYGVTQNVVWYAVKDCAKRAESTDSHRMICVVAARECAIWLAVNWSRSSFYWATLQFRRPSVISAASSG